MENSQAVTPAVKTAEDFILLEDSTPSGSNVDMNLQGLSSDPVGTKNDDALPSDTPESKATKGISTGRSTNANISAKRDTLISSKNKSLRSPSAPGASSDGGPSVQRQRSRETTVSAAAIQRKQPLSPSTSRGISSSSSVKTTSTAPRATVSPAQSKTITKAQGTARKSGVVSPTNSTSSTKTSTTTLRPRPSSTLSNTKLGSTRQSEAVPGPTLRRIGENTTRRAVISTKEDDTPDAELRDKLSAAELRMKEDTARIVKLESELKELRIDVDSKSKEAAGMVHLLTEKNAECDRLSSLADANALQASELEAVNAKLHIKMARLEEENLNLKALEYENTVWKAKANELKENIPSLESRYSALQDETQALRESLQASRDNAKLSEDATQRQLAELIAGHEKALLGMQEGHSAHIKELEGKISELQSAEAVLSDNLFRYKKEAEESRAKTEEVEIELLELCESLESSEEKNAHSLDALRQTQADLTVVRNLLQSSRAEHDEKIKRMEEQRRNLVAQYKNELAAAFSTSQNFSDDAQRAKELVSQLEAALDDLSKEHNRASEEYKKSMKELEASHRVQISDIEMQIRDLKASHLATMEGVQCEQRDALQKVFIEAKTAADIEHKEELQKLRLQAETTIEQITQVNKKTLEEARASLAADAAEHVEQLKKRLLDAELELKATREDLSKAKLSLSSKEVEVDSLLAAELEKSQAKNGSTPTSAPPTAEIDQLRKELDATNDELVDMRVAFQATKESIEAMALNHRRELEELTRSRVDEANELNRCFDQEKIKLIQSRDVALARIQEFEIELKVAKDHAQPPIESRSYGSPGMPAVTREELARLHEAHNLKIHSMEANHRRAIKELEDNLEQTARDKEELHSAADRREMEMHFLNTENEENADRIRRLEDEIEDLTSKLQSR